jgi:CRP-like cAMP-binding protein
VKNFDWKTFLKRHSVFSRLKDDDIEQILKDNESEERDCLQGSVIIREGEFSDSVFLIGTGSVQVVLQGKDGYEINISTLGKGEFFGEMAPVERIPRSATVIARENTTLLEVNGEKFCDIMRENPIIAFNVLLKLSERLRHVTEHVLAVKLKDADEKINLFNIKLDAELKAVEASMKAAQVVFEQTNTRTSEVIDSAERSRARLTIFGSVLGGFATVVISIFTWFGIEKLQNITEVERLVEETAAGIFERRVQIEELTESLKLLPKIQEISLDALLATYSLAVTKGDEKSAVTSFDGLLKLKDYDITHRLLVEIEYKITEKKKDLDIYERLLKNSLYSIDIPKEKIMVYYLLLTVLILDNKEDFYDTLSSFQEYVEDHKDLKVKDTLSIEDFDNLFKGQDQEKRTLFNKVKDLIP